MSTRAAMIGMTILRRRDGWDSGFGTEDTTAGAGAGVSVGTRRVDVSIIMVEGKAGAVAAAREVGVVADSCVFAALSVAGAAIAAIEGTRYAADCRLTRDKVSTGDKVDVTSALGEQGVSGFGGPSWQVAVARTAAGSNNTEEIIK